MSEQSAGSVEVGSGAAGTLGSGEVAGEVVGLLFGQPLRVTAPGVTEWRAADDDAAEG